jgi:hypothetical protein
VIRPSGAQCVFEGRFSFMPPTQKVSWGALEAAGNVHCPELWDVSMQPRFTHAGMPAPHPLVTTVPSSSALFRRGGARHGPRPERALMPLGAGETAPIVSVQRSTQHLVSRTAAASPPPRALRRPGWRRPPQWV